MLPPSQTVLHTNASSLLADRLATLSFLRVLTLRHLRSGFLSAFSIHSELRPL